MFQIVSLKMKMRFLGGEQVNFFHDEKNKKSHTVILEYFDIKE